jgi:hypothetical protein
MKAWSTFLIFAIFCGCATVNDEAQISGIKGFDDPGAIILRIHVVSVQPTDYYPASSCEKNEVCFPFYFWYKYKAKVRKVVRGKWQDGYIEFARIQHAQLVPAVTNDCYISLTKIDPPLSEQLNVQYVAKDFLSPLLANKRRPENGT